MTKVNCLKPYRATQTIQMTQIMEMKRNQVSKHRGSTWSKMAPPRPNPNNWHVRTVTLSLSDEISKIMDIVSELKN